MVVTGSSSGFGFETSLLLAQLGYRVFATMRNPGRDGERLASAARNAPGEIVVREVDVTDPEQVEAAVGEAAARDDLEAVVNNAGMGIAGFFEDLSDHEFRETLETNLFGLVSVTRTALPHLRRRGRGTIVQVSSIGARSATPGLSAYIASKSAVSGFSRTLRHELAPLGIRVAVFEPGTFRTEILGSKRRFATRIADGESSNTAVVRRLDSVIMRTAGVVAGDPARVARKIVDVIESPRPRARYAIGWDALLWPIVYSLPFGLSDRIVGRVLKSAGYPPE